MLDPRTGSVRRQMQVEAGRRRFWVSFSGDGRRVAVVEFTSTRGVVWQVASGELWRGYPSATAGEFTYLGADGATLYTAGSDGALRQWDVDGGRRFVAQVAFAPLKLGDL